MISDFVFDDLDGLKNSGWVFFLVVSKCYGDGSGASLVGDWCYGFQEGTTELERGDRDTVLGRILSTGCGAEGVDPDHLAEGCLSPP